MAFVSYMMAPHIMEGALVGIDWEARIKGVLKAELKRRGVTYAQLVDKLSDIGVSESEPNIRNKLARGKFTAVFFMQVLTAIGSRNVSFPEEMD